MRQFIGIFVAVPPGEGGFRIAANPPFRISAPGRLKTAGYENADLARHVCGGGTLGYLQYGTIWQLNFQKKTPEPLD